MTNIFIKNFSIIFWSLFVFIKSTNIRPTVKIIITQAVYSVVVSFLAVTMRLFLPEVIVVIIIVFASLFNKVTFKIKLSIAITATIIACGISYSFFTLSGAVTSLIFYFIFGFYEDNEKMMIFLTISVFFTMGLFVFLLSKIKRFKSGFPFLHDKYINIVGILIALIISIYYTVVDIIANRLEDGFNNLTWLSLAGIIICAVLVIIWWRTGITKTYKSYLRSKEIEELNNIINEKDTRIAEIEKSNDYLAKVVHSDNKLMPSLINAVTALREEYSKELCDDIYKELNRVSAERRGILHDYKKLTKKLPLTNITSLDLTLDFMMKKAHENNIEFDIIINGSVKRMIENCIEEERLRVITADLLENAIIAIKPCDVRKILFTIGFCDDCYEIGVNDSGIDFEQTTLQDLGKKQTTTHKNEGGSGIGMVEVFNVMRDTGASLIIQRLSDKRGFTKSVSVRFDGKNEYIY